MSSTSFRALFGVLAVSALTLACAVSGAPTVPAAPTLESQPTAGPASAVSPLPPATQPLAGLTPPAGGGEGQLTVESGPARIDNGYLKAAGRVRNGSQQYLTGATISFVFYDKTNTPIALEDTLGGSGDRVELDTGPVAPGEYGYFMLLRDLNGKTPAIDHQEVTAVGRWAASGATVELSGVKAGSLSADPISVTGTAKNTGQADCALPDVVVIGFAQDGSVYEVEGSPLEDSAGNMLPVLKAGDSIAFSAYLSNADTKVTKIIEGSYCSPN